MPTHVAIAHEPSDAEPRLIGWLAAGVAAFLVLTPLLLMQIYPAALRQPVSQLADDTFPPPRLQIDNASELQGLRRNSDQRLTTFGWIDRSKQIVHLPIERAISLTVERGLPGWQHP